MSNITHALLAAAAAVLISLGPSPAATAAGHDGVHSDHGTNHQAQGWDGGTGDGTDHDARDGHGNHGGHQRHHEHDHGKTHVCKRGGYQDLVRAETGVGFGNQGECLRHQALGGTYSSLTIDLETMYACGDDSESCFGLVDGMNLQPNSSVLVEWNSTEGDQSDDFARFDTDQSGGLSGDLNFRCDDSDNVISGLTVTGTTSAGATVTSDPVTVPCNANVVG